MENFGGPVWHASGCGRKLADSKTICHTALRGAGDASLGEWEGSLGRPDIWHVQRRLTDAEREQFAVPAPYDIRGTEEEHARIQAVFAEAPHLAGRLMSL